MMTSQHYHLITVSAASRIRIHQSTNHSDISQSTDPQQQAITKQTKVDRSLNYNKIRLKKELVRETKIYVRYCYYIWQMNIEQAIKINVRTFNKHANSNMQWRGRNQQKLLRAGTDSFYNFWDYCRRNEKTGHKLDSYVKTVNWYEYVYRIYGKWLSINLARHSNNSSLCQKTLLYFRS